MHTITGLRVAISGVLKAAVRGDSDFLLTISSIISAHKTKEKYCLTITCYCDIMLTLLLYSE